jgi:hypothetical protein
VDKRYLRGETRIWISPSDRKRWRLDTKCISPSRVELAALQAGLAKLTGRDGIQHANAS